MRLAIKQPYFSPHLAYFQEIFAVDKFIIYNNLNFIKDGWINRNKINCANNTSYITVPLKKKSSNKKIHEVEICNVFDWRRKMLKSIQYNYCKTSYFNEVFPLLQSIIHHPTNLIWELASNSTVRISRFLEIETEIQTDVSNYYDLDKKLEMGGFENIRDFKDLNIHTYTRKVIRIIFIALKENADVFINSIGGRAIYEQETFQKHNIDFRFLFQNPLLNQSPIARFSPNLSIIHTLMHFGKAGTMNLLREYTLM